MPTPFRESQPIIERVREETYRVTAPDGVLDFYSVAIDLGCSSETAEEIDLALTTRTMRARGAI